jgi:hypothetical protein
MITSITLNAALTEICIDEDHGNGNTTAHYFPVRFVPTTIGAAIVFDRSLPDCLDSEPEFVKLLNQWGRE